MKNYFLAGSASGSGSVVASGWGVNEILCKNTPIKSMKR
jgi:hypothetical protein